MRIRDVYETNVNSRLTQIGPQFRYNNRWCAVFLCECGEHCVVQAKRYRTGHTKSCGCYHRESAVRVCTTHGKSKTSEYRIWASMRQRCFDKNCLSYPRYGGSGISMCGRWNSFEAFLEDMGPRPTPKHSIDRIDNSKGYCPENCRWATVVEQARNKSNNLWIEAFGKRMLARDWAKVYGVKELTIRKRVLVQGWDHERAVSVLPRKKICESKN